MNSTMKKPMVVIPVLLVAALVGWNVFAGSGESSSPANNEETSVLQQENSSDQAEVAEIKQGSYSLSEVAEHDTAEDCWTVIDDFVYDLTEFIPGHPGGPQILQACGTDASQLFKNLGFTNEQAVTIREMNELPEDLELHSPSARELLDQLKIGALTVE